MSRGKMFSDISGSFNRPKPPTSDKRKWCENERFHAKEAPSGRVRCPDCSRLLYLRESHCVGGEIVGWKFPPHKEKVKTKKMASRSNKNTSRKGRKD